MNNSDVPVYTIITALVKKLGGSVKITSADVVGEYQGDLTITSDPIDKSYTLEVKE